VFLGCFCLKLVCFIPPFRYYILVIFFTIHHYIAPQLLCQTIYGAFAKFVSFVNFFVLYAQSKTHRFYCKRCAFSGGRLLLLHFRCISNVALISGGRYVSPSFVRADYPLTAERVLSREQIFCVGSDVHIRPLKPTP